MSTLSLDPDFAHDARDYMPLHGIDHIELWVGNAAQAAFYFRHAFGFTEVAYAGLETGLRDRVSHVLQQGRIRLVLTGTLRDGTDIGEHQRVHGDGVKVVALSVPSVDAAYREAVAHGASGLRRAVRAARRARRRADRRDRRLRRDRAPLRRARRLRRAVPAGLRRGRVRRRSHPARPAGRASTTSWRTSSSARWRHWVKYYEDVFAMTELIHFSDEAISTEYSALMSKVVTSGDGRVKLPINEPAEGARKSQIDEYLEFYGGPGRAAHRGLDDRHRADRRRAVGARGAVPAHAGLLLRRRARAGRARSRSRSTICGGWGSSSTATTRATCCRCSPSRWATARRCSSRSSSATARAASARATSRRCSRRSSASRQRGGISDAVRVDGRRSGQAPHAGARRGRRRAAARRGGHGLRGLLGQRVDPLPPAVAVRRGRGGRVRAVGARRSGCPTRTCTG